MLYASLRIAAHSDHGKRAVLVGVAVMRVHFVELKVRFVFEREEVGVGLGEEERRRTRRRSAKARPSRCPPR